MRKAGKTAESKAACAADSIILDSRSAVKHPAQVSQDLRIG